jgi:hypothetical protein
VTGGSAFTRGAAPGAFGRLELEISTGQAEVRPLVLGVLAGAMGWGAPDGGGGGIPTSFYLGVHGPVFATLGLGWDWLLYDHVLGTGGFGILAPFATANVGLDFDSVRIVLDARVQYRWQWGAEDRAQLTTGLSLSFNDG